MTLLFHSLQAQESKYYKFGKIDPKDFVRSYGIDTSAAGVILSDINEISFEPNKKGWFAVSTIHHCVIHILKKNAYGYATVEIPMYSSGEDIESSEAVKAVSYNMEDGRLVETKLDKKNIYLEKRSDQVVLKKFTLPNVKEGTIIEYQYKVLSDFYQIIDPWYFQGALPRLWSECRFSVPQVFGYAFLVSGYRPFAINERKESQTKFHVYDNSLDKDYSFPFDLTTVLSDYRWVMVDVPSIKEEPYTRSIKKNTAGIEFQFACQNYPLTIVDAFTSWPSLTTELLKTKGFRAALDSNKKWLDTLVASLGVNGLDTLSKARKIYSYVQDHYKNTGKGRLDFDTELPEVVKKGRGSVVDINLLLIALLRYCGVNAEGMVLSTTDNGPAYEYYPLLNRLNYLIVRTEINRKKIYLDASQQGLAFGKLLPNCYNGPSWIVDESATIVNFSPDSLWEKKTSATIVSNTAKGEWLAHVKRMPGDQEAYLIRKAIRETDKKAFSMELEKSYGAKKLLNLTIDSLYQAEDPLVVSFDVPMTPDGEEVLYISPFLSEPAVKNPFSSGDRYYPVEMPFATDETFHVSMEVPNGYMIDELPRQMLAKYDEEGTTFFEYKITASGNLISFRARVKIGRTYYGPDEYEQLRQFFTLLIKKQQEPIVFRKKH
jgi:hypothetical protein